MVRSTQTAVDPSPDLYLAFDKAVVSDPPFEAVIHTASPFHFNVTDTKKDLLDPGNAVLNQTPQATSDPSSHYRYHRDPESNQEKRPYR